MSQKIKAYIKLQINGGAAAPSGSIGSALGSKGVNIMDFCRQFNARTQDKQGDLLRVMITVYEDKPFTFIVKTSPASVLLIKKANLKKGSSEPNMKKVGDVTWDDVKEIAESKMVDLNAFCLNSAMKMIAGTARSIGINVNGQAPWDLK